MASRFLGSLQEDALQMLIQAIETKGVDFGKCVPAEEQSISVPSWDAAIGPQLLLMLAYRWKDVPHPPNPRPTIRKLCFCSYEDPSRVCVNPYHWCIHLNPDFTPPNNVVYMKTTRPCDLDGNIVSQATGGTEELYNQYGHPWCEIRYWEGRERKGSSFKVLQPVINILGETPCGSGLSLAAFFGGPSLDQKITETRQKICQGLVLWQENDEVWVYNRSEAPIYLDSATLDASFYHLRLYKCPPGSAMVVYHYETARHLMSLDDYDNPLMAQADVNSVRISFAKGWGSNYHRREIFSCPCWMEIYVCPTAKMPPR